MKKNFFVAFALALALTIGMASPAKAVLAQVSGTLLFQVSTWNPFPGVLNDGNPFTINIDPTTGAFSLPASIYQAHGRAGTIYTLPASLHPLGPVTLTGKNFAGNFGPAWTGAPGTGPNCPTGGANVNNCVPASGFGGLMGLQVNAHLYTGAPTLTMPPTTMSPLLTLPLSMFGDYNNNVFTTKFPMSGWGNGWTTGQAFVSNNTGTNTFANTNIATITGNFWDGAYITEVGSTINLVTSAFLREFGSTNIPVIATMSITILSIVPEPSTALLVGVGLLGLIVAGRRKQVQA